MKSILTFLTVLFAGSVASAQTMGAWKTDSAVTGNAAGKDVFRKLDNPTNDSAAGTNWTLAFQMIPQGGPSSNVAIFANQVRQNVMVYSLHYSAAAKFASLTAADTVGRTSQPLYNSDATWAMGALNQMSNPGNVFDFSWGKYNMTTHNVVGDSLYLLKTQSGDYKLWVQQYISSPIDSIRYEFRIAKFDGSGDTTVKMYRKDGFTNALFGYYNAVDRTIQSREPARNNWELLFTRYYEQVTQGPTTAMYPVTGILHNVGVTVAEVIQADADAAAMNYRNNTFSTDIHTIGSDWKTFNMQTNTYTIDTAKNYLIRSDVSGKYYQLRFSGFSGSGTGIFRYKFRELGTTLAVNNIAEPVQAFMLAPNPTSAETQILLDVKTAETAHLLVTDAMGRTIQSNTVKLNAGLNGYQLSLGAIPAGTYFVTVATGSWTKTAQLLIQH
ncbi:MAG: T9SS type A sorting domain-containing protein [Sphingobacteriales bacterium]|nr:MAG: T9SS type A sorting domain-containing protein [Sphingobacteriales bacterium]